MPTEVAGTANQPLTVPQVANYLQVGEKAIYNAIARRELGHVRVGRSIRIRPDQITAFLNRSEP